MPQRLNNYYQKYLSVWIDNRSDWKYEVNFPFPYSDYDTMCQTESATLIDAFVHQLGRTLFDRDDQEDEWQIMQEKRLSSPLLPGEALGALLQAIPADFPGWKWRWVEIALRNYQGSDRIVRDLARDLFEEPVQVSEPKTEDAPRKRVNRRPRRRDSPPSEVELAASKAEVRFLIPVLANWRCIRYVYAYADFLSTLSRCSGHMTTRVRKYLKQHDLTVLTLDRGRTVPIDLITERIYRYIYFQNV